MNRRRFVPAAEGLEGRTLLSLNLLGGTNSLTNPNPTAVTPNTFTQKTTRVEHLPFYLNKLQPGRTLPTDLMDQLRADLHELTGQLHTPPDPVVQTFNANLRSVLDGASISGQDVKTLNRDFGAVLRAAGARPDVVGRLQDDMARLANVDSVSPQPVELVSNDYSLVLQTALGIGKPIRRPGPLRLLPADNTGSTSDNVTSVNRPRLVGTYDAGTTMQLLDGTGAVLGAAVVASNGHYTIQPDAPLTPGTHTLTARAVADTDIFSPPSAALRVKIVAPPTMVVGAAHPTGPST